MVVVIGFNRGNMIVKKIFSMFVLFIFVVFLSFFGMVEWMKLEYKNMVNGI